MAIRSDNDFPELVPFDDRLPSRAGLFRRAEEITDDQFALLAAEWAEGESGADSFSEIETIFASCPEKRALAEDFKRIRLVPNNEKWTGSGAMIKATPAAVYIKRAIYGTIASAAVLLAFLALSPLLRNSVLQSSPAMLPEVGITASATSPAGEPLPATKKNRAALIQSAVSREPLTVNLRADAGHQPQHQPQPQPRPQPLDFRNHPETVRLVADASDVVSVVAGTASLKAPARMPVIPDILPVPGEANWIIRGITALSGIVTGKDKPVDGYIIAGACVKGINSVLGWEMNLERVVSDEGNPLAVNFSSSLLSFSTPAKKSADEP